MENIARAGLTIVPVVGYPVRGLPPPGAPDQLSNFPQVILTFERSV